MTVCGFFQSEVASTKEELKAGDPANEPTRSAINSRIMDGPAPNCDQLNHGLRGFLYIERWLSKSIATARESHIYLPKLDLFAPP